MNSDWILVPLTFLILVIIPRAIVEGAWVRRLRRKPESTNIASSGGIQGLPWLPFVAVGIVGAVVAIVLIRLAN